jgi:hypothetical protein
LSPCGKLLVDFVDELDATENLFDEPVSVQSPPFVPDSSGRLENHGQRRGHGFLIPSS